MYKLEKTTAGYDIVINGFEDGISQNPYEGIADMRNVDPSTIPGESSVAMKTESMITQGAISGVTFTVDNTTDIFTYNGSIPLEVNSVITVSNSGGSLPTGMAVNTAYYIKTIPSATTFTLSSVSAGGTTLNVTTNGTGTNSFSTVNVGTPKFIVTTTLAPEDGISGLEAYRYYFLLDSNGRCWVYDNGFPGSGSTYKWIYMHNLSSEGTLGNGNGLIAWKSWVFVWSSSNLQVIPLNNSYFSTLAFLTTKANWTDWQTASNLGTNTTSHYALIGFDDAIYFCNGFGVGSILLNPQQVFAPNTGRVVANGVTTINDATITSATIAFTTLDIGSSISGAGIPAGTQILSINSATSAEMTRDATATAAGVTFTIPNSYTYNGSALALPSTDEAVCLAELGTSLLVGGINNYIYPWDRVSTSYSFPIFCSENYISRMVTINTTTYIFCGRRGRIFYTNGSNADFYWKIPDYLSNTVNPTFVWADANFNRNQLYFGFQVKTNSGTTINEYGGLWTIDTRTGGGWLVNQLSYGTYSGYASALIAYRGDIRSSTTSTGPFGSNTGYGLFVGWNDGTNGGIDKGISTPYTGGQSYVSSDMIPVGTFLTKKTFSNIEYKLTTPLVAGESVALYYRKNITDAYSGPLTIIGGGSTGDVSGYANVDFEQVQWIQIKPVLTSTASSPSFVRLKEIRIR